MIGFYSPSDGLDRLDEAAAAVRAEHDVPVNATIVTSCGRRGVVLALCPFNLRVAAEHGDQAPRQVLVATGAIWDWYRVEELRPDPDGDPAAHIITPCCNEYPQGLP